MLRSISGQHGITEETLPAADAGSALSLLTHAGRFASRNFSKIRWYAAEWVIFGRSMNPPRRAIARTTSWSFGHPSAGYDATYPSVLRYCLRRVGRRDLTEDIVSTVFLSVASKMRDFPGETFVDFRRWIFTITTNEINATFRKTSRHQSILVQAADAGTFTEQMSQARRELLDTHSLKTALGRLAGLAACVVAIASYSVMRLDRGMGDSMADRDALASNQVDGEYLAAVTTVNEFREEMSEDAFFFALAMCEQQHEPLSTQKSN